MKRTALSGLKELGGKGRKREMLLSVGLSAMLLAGCSSTSDPVPPASEDASESPTASPTLAPGEALQAAFPDTKCIEDEVEEIWFLQFEGICAGYTAYEFDHNATRDNGEVVSKKTAVDAVVETYGKNQDYDPWLVSDDWLISHEEKFLVEMSAKFPEAEIVLPSQAPRLIRDQLPIVEKAIKDVSGITCNAKGELDGLELVAKGCKKPNGDYYAIVGFYRNAASVLNFMSDAAKPFTLGDRDTYLVQGDRWVIFDVNEDDAYELADTLDAEVENLNGY